jgi:tetratricopeptide (TPR) repeat protein
MKNKIEELIKKDDWAGARREIRASLKRQPDDHWLLTRLGLTYYEQHNYKKARETEEKAIKLAPKCPLVLWDYAGSLQALDLHEEAIKIYRRLIAKGVNRIAFGECGEGKAWARGLIADCYYRLALSYQAMGDEKLALKALERHLDLRGPGCQSIYPLKKLTVKYQILKNKRRGLNKPIEADRE